MKKLGLFLGVIMVICLLFTVSCVNKEVPVTETYYETEYRAEYHTDIIKSGEDELMPEYHWYCDNLLINWQPAASENNSLPSQNESYTPFEESIHQFMQSQIYTGPRSFEGVWYLGYKIPQHSSGKVIIQTWEREIKEAETVSLDYFDMWFSCGKKDEMVSAYDVTKSGYLVKPPFDKPLYVYVVYPGELYPGRIYEGREPKLNVYPYEEQKFNEWLDQFNVQMKTSHLDTQLYCPKCGRDGCRETPRETYEFNVTGVESLAIIVAGREYRGRDKGLASLLREPLQGEPWPIKSIKLIWSDEVTNEQKVPYQVEKQRTVMQIQKIPFWEAIFH